MELLSNLTWVLVTFVLWGLWFAHERRKRGRSVLPEIAAQLIALAMLTAILLPVISVTDDLQAGHNPAELERCAGKSDHHASLQQQPHSVPVRPALMPSCARASHLHTLSWLPPERARAGQQSARARALWSRPPPAA
ncbi:MAG TPA: hypothetical protein VME68_12680 [Acidobacteriaceae bacterium]|nr:hypothetical protein [Acidobacteriaceae bacterium]